MSEIKYKITQVYAKQDRIELSSHTAWLGDICLSREEFEEVGRPTVGDTLIMSLRPFDKKANEGVKS